MVTFGQGHSGPKVVLLQIVLSTRPPQASLRVDGIFGPATAAALRAFQTHHRLLPPTGRVDGPTWQALMRVTALRTIDIADVDDLIVAMQENPSGTVRDWVRNGHQYGLIAAGELARAQQRDIVSMVGMSNGVPVMVSRVITAAGSSRIALLRIFGHGNRGLQIVSAGRGVSGGSAAHHAALTPRSVAEMRSDLERLRPLFAACGSAELHGCSVGRGPAGRNLVRDLVDVWGVPVTAGTAAQHVGRGATFRFEGPTITGYPNGGTLPSWAAAAAAASASSRAAAG